MSDEPSKEKTTFNLDKYKIKTENQTYTIQVQDDEFDVVVKPVTWQLKNELVAKCMNFSADGNSSFDSGVYIKEVLKAIIIEAPWGKTTDDFLNSISSDLGSALEQLVPSAFETNFGDVNVVKKG